MTAEGAHARHREQHIRRLLAEHADTVIPGDGITAIRARIARRPWWRRAWDAVRAADRWLATGFASITLTPHSTNGAPDAPGTPPITTAVKEPTMHELTEERGPRWRQMTATLALFHLLECRLPEASWRIDENGLLSGHVLRPEDDGQARADLDQYAQFFGAHVQRSQGHEHGEEWLHLSAASMYRGVAVSVWTHVDVRPVSPYASFGGTR